MDLNAIVFGQITVKEFLIWGGGVLVLLVYLRFLRKHFKKKKMSIVKNATYYHCSYCQWQGHVAKYAKICPKCGVELDLEFMALG